MFALSRKFPRDELYGRRDWNIAADSAECIPRDISYAKRRVVTPVLPLSAFSHANRGRDSRAECKAAITHARARANSRPIVSSRTDPAVVFNDLPFRHSRWQYLRQCNSAALTQNAITNGAVCALRVARRLHCAEVRKRTRGRVFNWINERSRMRKRDRSKCNGREYAWKMVSV